MTKAAAIILAGGKSSRMGKNKALITVKDCRMLEGIIRELTGEFREIIVSANDNTYDELGIRTVRDIFPGRGPLGGIHAGLTASGHDINFLVACDMPFINVELAVYMAGLADGYDAVVPQIGSYYQPLFAVYTRNCLKAIDDRLVRGDFKITSFFPDVRTRFVCPDEIGRFGNPEKLFFNVNTPVDLKTAKSMAGRDGFGPEV